MSLCNKLVGVIRAVWAKDLANLDMFTAVIHVQLVFSFEWIRFTCNALAGNTAASLLFELYFIRLGGEILVQRQPVGLPVRGRLGNSLDRSASQHWRADVNRLVFVELKDIAMAGS